MTRKDKALFTKWDKVEPVCDICGGKHMTKRCHYNDEDTYREDYMINKHLPCGFHVVSLQEMEESILTTDEDLWCDSSEIRKPYDFPKDKRCPKCGAHMFDEKEALHCIKCGTMSYQWTHIRRSHER